MAVGFVQGTGDNFGWVTSGSKAFLSNVTAGNAIIVAIALNAITDKVSSVTDNLGNSYTRRIRTINDDNSTSYIYESLNIAGGACTVTVTLSPAENFALGIAEASGLPVSAAIDVSSGAYGSSAAAQTSLVTTNTDIIFGVVCVQATGAITPDAGWTQIYENENYSTHTINFIYRIGAAGSYTALWANTNIRWVCSAAAYKPAAAGGGLLKIIVETLQLSETKNRNLTLRRYKNESENITEGVIRQVSLRRLVNETLQLIDSKLRTLNLRRLVNETLTIIDTIYKTLGLKRLLNETIQITDSVLRYIQKLIKQIIGESLQISDSILKRRSIRRIISETMRITDSIYRRISFRKTITEIEQITDSALKAILFRKVMSETIQISDEAIRSVLGAMVRIAAETLNLIDSNLRRISFRRIISESENIVEAIRRRISFRKVILEIVSMPENIINNKFFSKIVNEVINVTEQVGRWLGVLGAAIIKVINETVWINDIASLFKIVYLAGKKAIIFYVDNIKRTFTIDNIKRTFTIDNIKRTFYGK